MTSLPVDGLGPVDAAVVAQACTASSVLWVRTAGSQRHHLAWFAWRDGVAYVIQGVDEQSLPLMSGQVEVVVPSKDTGARLVSFVAQADILPARSGEWEAAAEALSSVRLNAPDPAGQRDRWASGTLITRLTPRYVAAAGPGDDATPSGAAPPADSGAGTQGVYRPWHLRGRSRARRAARTQPRR